MKELANLLSKTDLEPVSQGVLDDLNRFYEHVIRVNQVMNLTSLTSREDFSEKHLLDSFYLLPHLEGNNLLDLGSGLGVPGLVLKLTQPKLQVTLVDALKKRVEYLTETISDFNLEEIKAIHGRFEDIGQDKNYRESFDTVVARAVADLPLLLEYAIPFVKIGGIFIAMKGKNAPLELSRAQQAIVQLGADLEKSLNYTLPSGDERHLLIFRKLSSTPKTYPRKPHIIKKKPL